MGGRVSVVYKSATPARSLSAPLAVSLFTRKSLADLRLESERSLLRRSLGPLNLTALGIGSIIATGIFVLTGTAASQNAGPALLVSALLVIGIRQSAGTNTALVLIKSLVLVFFVVLCASYVRRENLTPFVPPNEGSFGAFGWSGVLRGAGVMFFAYIGFDAVSTAAQEAKRPARDMPIGILASLAICTVLYVCVAIVLLGIVPYQQLMVPDPLAIGIDATGLTWLSPIIKIAALFGLFSTMLVNLLAQTRIFYSM